MSVEELIDACGFEARGICPADKLEVRDEVRDMCASGKCHMYDTNWACPPACGDIESYQKLIDGYKTCYVAQTVAQLEDEFDGETMMEAADTQAKRFTRLLEMVKERYPDALILASGTCTLCPSCTYPNAPCRLPEKRMTSMEAAGLLVSDVCNAAGVPYNHGTNTIAYTGCVLVKE